MIVTVAMILETAGAVAVVKLAMIQETVKEPMPGMLKTENFKDIAEGVASVLVQETADVVVVFTVVMQTSEDKNGVARLQTNAYTEKKAFLPNQLMFLRIVEVYGLTVDSTKGRRQRSIQMNCGLLT